MVLPSSYIGVIALKFVISKGFSIGGVGVRVGVGLGVGVGVGVGV